MAKKDKEKQQDLPIEEPEEAPEAVETPQETPEAASQAVPEETQKKTPEEPKAIPWEEKYNAEHDSYLRLYADYDNYRKRTVKEKDMSYSNGKCDAVAKMLPVYDNLERALNQPTEDAAYKKGVEMTMNELVKIFTGLGVEIFGQVGETFDPALHNAVMHTEDSSVGENTISAVFQKGFRLGGKVVRFAMVQVAN